MHSESKCIRIVCLCVSLSVSLCLPLSLWRSRDSRQNSNERQNTKHDHNQNRGKKKHDQYYRNQFEVSLSLTLLKITKHSKLAHSARQKTKNTMKRKKTHKSWKRDQKLTRGWIFRSFVLSIFPSVCFPCWF